jgi:ribosome-binding ATPase YchF (GTP1/OBG family)
MTSRDYLRQRGQPSPAVISIQQAIELQSGESLRDTEVFPVSLSFEEEIRRIRSEEGTDAVQEYFIANPTHISAVETILTLTHRNLGLIHFYTASEREIKCWCLKQGKTILESSAMVDVNITR